ncbi:hypothetical protein MNEG_10356 [Monoraphidium neglectum]|uniref:Large ribosomal subunit protein uL23 N-terminal domain-containing protein n=1 Tax=Monoraphidium neglectum TaxID=145388 RepID=A0A0D2MSY5_9CHLO|nr:hypothetical protein MNEG_10356 [Monoraphidium neglectum]KIY97605.1 hypothetical protein MNEG_10356 [Monoraphidium neglectum]|eukprot:XP_013896625.1 hypothetical protein MNEG_10356 [Monoraphidium neglectum]
MAPKGKDAKAAAAKAAAAVKKNSWAKTRKPRYSVVFHRPKTLKRTRDPKYTRKSANGSGCGGTEDSAWQPERL